MKPSNLSILIVSLLFILSTGSVVVASLSIEAETVNFLNPIGVGTPTAGNHAATRDYIDSAIINIGIGGYVPTSRNIATGSGLTGGGNLTADRTLSVDSTVIRTTGNQTLAGTKTFSSPVVASHYNVVAAVGNGLRFWASDSYKISMGNTAEYRYGSVTDYSIKTSMSNTTTRGWTWGVVGVAPIAAINTQGHMNIAGSLVVGGTATVATPTAASHAATKAYVNSAVSGSASKWTTSGTDIYRLDGNVGIGTTTPSAKLHVNGNIIAADPTEDNHVVTKAYVDVLWPPQGCNPGDILLMGNDEVICGGTLTWQGSTKTWFACMQIGGTVFDTGATGTICRYPGSTVPAGWTQAAHWQRYGSSTWGGDVCGCHLSSGPDVFSNEVSVIKTQGASAISGTGCDPNCVRWKHPLYDQLWTVATIYDSPSNRVEVGIY